jgi:hypothetical protein
MEDEKVELIEKIGDGSNESEIWEAKWGIKK